MSRRTILIHAQAPAKPPEGGACNGCGVCCAAAPCPLGIWVSKRRSGACSALLWQENQQHYRCGVLVDPARWLPWLPAALARRLAWRWIAAAQACDSDLLTA